MTTATAVSLVYEYDGGLYVNLTSRCPTACAFCIKFSWDYKYRGHDLKLPTEPTVDEILSAAPPDLSKYREVVFCGYGESTYRLAEMKTLAAAFRARGARRIRLNTVGLGSLINGRNIAPELTFLDAVSISLNTVDPDTYLKIMRPRPEFRDRALASVKKFIVECARAVPNTTVTAVALPGVDPAGVENVARAAGARYRLRPHLDAYEEE
ncbi:MAG TPA: TatD family nuclease-associated radical SAM protein, partial [Elusimicrobiota bacterium]|nr:TatD family nuclease-associated radical SAM protein [Elusimicrobiota bacterium]